jgi:hypothetical protein
VGSTLVLAHPLYYKRLVQLASIIFGTINSFRSSLSPITVEALICTQDWLLDRLSIDEFDDLLESCDDLGNVFKLIICKFIYFSLLINLFNFSYCRWASSFKFNDGIIF